VIGTLSFGSRSRPQFGDHEIEVMKAVTDLVAIAMHRITTESALREAGRRKDEFLAILAHELRNPLAPVCTGLRVLQESNKYDPAEQRILAMLQRQVDHLVRLVDDLLEVTRITQGKIELRKQLVDLRTVIEQAIETSQPRIEAGEHKVDVTLPGIPLFVEGDPARLTQVFANLLNNAATYMRAGGDVFLTVERRDSQALVSVRDQGIGIAAEMLPRVFDLFTRIDDAFDRSRSGLGVGLYLARRLIEMHGGRIEVRSQGLGQGSEFLVALPIAEDSQGVAASETRRLATTALARRVLVVDDNRDAAESLDLYLTMLGAEVRTAYDGVAALETLQTFKPSVVLLDLGMPGMDGYEAARSIRASAHGSDVTLIALTGWGQDEDRRRTAEAGFDHHLVKPVDLDELEALLRRN
jgi:CheY-like chemotaxis protein